jgi:uncharacterized integral membrane protein (TIGR00698 family)
MLTFMDAPPRTSLAPIPFALAALACLTPWVGPGGALVMGIVLALAVGNPWPRPVSVWTKRVLAWSIVGLGAGMNLGVVLKAGAHGLALTFCTILTVLGLGALLAKLLQVRGKAGVLVSAGTAICGGSAIAALAPAIDAPEEDTSLALATVFLLNAAGLVLFPAIGHALGLDQRAFGFWSALAIHDTSSVVGAGLAYGPQALQIGTTVKLARALWIVPLTFGAAAFTRKKDAPRKHPWFILGFLLAAAACTWLPGLQAAGSGLAALARKGMALALLGIGAGISPQGLKRVGPRPLIMGLVLWIIVATGSLLLIRAGLF